MKYLLLYFQKYWEVAVLYSTAILMLIVIVPFLFTGSGIEEVTGSGKGALKRESALSQNAFAFLEDGKLELTKSPFKLNIKAPEPPKPKPAPPKPAPKPAPPPPPPKEEPKEEKPEPPKPAPQQVAFQIVPGVITFTFQQMNSSGKTVAILSAQGRGTPLQSFTVGVGDDVIGTTVLAISEETLLMRDAKNRRVAIPIGTKKQLWMKITQEN